MRSLVVWVGLFLVLAGGRSALAGGCPVCKGPADCAGGFCVLYSAPIGCGTQLQTCCPGQACRLDPNGRPSCENGGTCTVVTGSLDGGVTADAGAVVDAAPTGDGGSKPGSTSGCSCRAGSGRGGSHGGLLGLGLLGLGVVLGWRRRR